MGLLTGKIALIFGLANERSIAWGIAKALAKEGATLGFSYAGPAIERHARPLVESMGSTFFEPCDVSSDEEIKRVAEKSAAAFGKIDILIHSIAFANREDLSRPFVETSRAGYLLAQEVSAYSLVAVARAVAPLMTHGGSVVTLSYLGATRVVENYNVMGVAKAALEAAVRYLAADLGPAGIRVNAISAGPVKTTSARGIRDFSKVLDGVAKLSPLRRNTDPAEVADAAVFLASDLGRGVTANVLFVDCGFQAMGLAH